MNKLHEMLKAVSHHERLQVAFILDEHKELNVSDIQAKMNIPQPVASQHLLKMRNIGFLISDKRGASVYYSLSKSGSKLMKHLSEYFSINENDND